MGCGVWGVGCGVGAERRVTARNVVYDLAVVDARDNERVIRYWQFLSTRQSSQEESGLGL